MESVVVLCNHLHRTLSAHHHFQNPNNPNNTIRPSKPTLEAMCAAYQAERAPRMRQIMAFSSLLTKLQAWDSLLLRFLAT
ncbi:MAG: hypothetical protein Q9170_007552, partial [Blastenia crenularia]